MQKILKIILVLVSSSLSIGMYHAMTFKLPTPITVVGPYTFAPGTRYNQVSWLGAHNAFASTAYGYTFANQNLSIPDQLNQGVRAISLDIYDHNGGIKLCHGACSGPNILLQPLPTQPQDLSRALKDIKAFLDTNKSAIVTLNFENYVSDQNRLAQYIIDAIGEDIILKPSDWDVTTQQGWPTIEWMQQNNKRLVILDDKSGNRLTFYIWNYALENQYGELATDKAAQLRSSAQAERDPVKYLYNINYFPKAAADVNMDQINSSGLRDLINRIRTNGVRPGRYQGRYPNIIWLDFVTKGNPLSIVQEINTHFRNTKDPNMFQPVK